MYKLILLILICTFSKAFCAESACMDKWNSLKHNYDLPESYKALDGLCDEAFKKALAKVISTNIDLKYNNARKIMFSELDNYNGTVCDVYTNYCIETEGIPASNLMNCEHSWPQSMGAVGIAKSDLNHLYPTKSNVNSIRNNKPYCEVVKSSWALDGSALGWSNSGTRCFEPRNEHKGAVARALLYFSVRYAQKIDPEQEAFIKKWNNSFSPDEKEIERNNKVEEFQHNRNPFIDIPDFSNLISDF